MALYTDIKGPVSYTVVGSPTINNGIVGNFSSSNYLQLQQTFVLNKDSIIEFKTKINMSTISVGNGIIGYPNKYYFHLIITSDNKINLYMGDGNSWSLINGKKGTTVFSKDTDYYIKIIINKGNVKCFLSTDDINYTLEFEENITITSEYNYSIVYGRARTSSQYIHGTLDLNKTYIRVNNFPWFGSSFSKVKLRHQSTVKYSIIGNVNINNGIATGFTDKNDYLTLPAFTPNTSKWKFITKIKFNSLTANMSLIDRNSSTRCFQISIRTNGKWRVNISIDGSTKATEVDGSHTLSINTVYYLSFEYTGTQYILKYSTDTTNWTTDITIDNSSPIYSGATQCMGHTWYDNGGEKWDGEINLNYTHLIIEDTNIDSYILHC